VGRAGGGVGGFKGKERMGGEDAREKGGSNTSKAREWEHKDDAQGGFKKGGGRRACVFEGNNPFLKSKKPEERPKKRDNLPGWRRGEPREKD